MIKSMESGALDHVARLNRVFGMGLPLRVQNWVKARNCKIFLGNVPLAEACAPALIDYQQRFHWDWPKKPVFFFSDLHADPMAFKRSLMASGGVESSGRRACDIALTGAGAGAEFIIGGDLFDKGPSNLGLLRVVKKLIDLGATVEILAGNHDVRTYIGMEYMGRKEIQHAHLFTRMGGKTMTLFKEIYREYVQGTKTDACLYSEQEIKTLFFPDENWFEAFPEYAKDIIHPAKLEKEMKRIREKVGEISEKAKENGMSLQNLYATVMKCRELFLSPKGEFSWLFQRMTLSKRIGSFLFVHGGVDDVILHEILEKDPDELKRWFHDHLANDAFTMYHGTIGNAFRTKYREYDWTLSDEGIHTLHENGVHAIVHGHLILKEGQRMVLRRDLLNIQCDCSLDRNTRKILALRGEGTAVTIFSPEGRIYGLSRDYPEIKCFQPTGFPRGGGH